MMGVRELYVYKNQTYKVVLVSLLNHRVCCFEIYRNH